MSLCLVVYIIRSTVWLDNDSFSLNNCTCIQLLDREYQVPVLSPNDVAAINGETAELTGIKILVVLRMWVTADEVTNINHPGGIVAECQAFVSMILPQR